MAGIFFSDFGNLLAWPSLVENFRELYSMPVRLRRIEHKSNILEILGSHREVHIWGENFVTVDPEVIFFCQWWALILKDLGL